MKNVSVHKRITVNLTPEQWQLYTASMNCSIAADELNRLFEQSFNSGKLRKEVRAIMEKRMSDLSSFGAYDTEPLAILEDLLDLVYAEAVPLNPFRR